MKQKYESKFHPEVITEDFLKKYKKSTGFDYDASEDNNYFDIVCIDYFYLTNIGEVGIYVFGKDGNCPHFHIIGNSFETCIMILDSKYYHANIDILSDIQIEELIKELNKSVKSYANSIWDCILFNWNDFNDSEISADIPNYKLLKEEK